MPNTWRSGRPRDRWASARAICAAWSVKSSSGCSRNAAGTKPAPRSARTDAHTALRPDPEVWARPARAAVTTVTRAWKTLAVEARWREAAARGHVGDFDQTRTGVRLLRIRAADAEQSNRACRVDQMQGELMPCEGDTPNTPISNGDAGDSDVSGAASVVCTCRANSVSPRGTEGQS